MNEKRWEIMWTCIVDVVMVLVIGLLAWKISLLALLGLFFMLRMEQGQTSE